MIKPYGAVCLTPTTWGTETRQDIRRNLEHIEEVAAGALWLSSLDAPVRLLALPEGALQGFNDEALDRDPQEFIKACAIEVPGPETKRLGKLAKAFNCFIIAQAKATDPDWPDLFFNIGFIIDPSGEVILRHHKVSVLLPCERSCSPHDLFDPWIEKYGRSLQSFWPVVDTEIGRLGIMMAMEGSYPENGRGLGLNGAEVVYRGSFPNAFTSADMFEITNRCRALENNFYVVAPNVGGIWTRKESAAPIDAGGGHSMIVDYKGHLIAEQRDSNYSTYCSATIDIEAMRFHRIHAQSSNWSKDIRTELAQLIYEKPIYPKNLYVGHNQSRHREYKEKVLDKQVRLMVERGIWRNSAYDD